MKKGQITRIKKGVYQVRVQARINGKRKSLSQTVCGTRKDADAALELILETIKTAPVKILPDRKSFDELFDAFLEIIKPNIREQTFYLYERLIKNYLRPEFGANDVTTLDPLTIEKFYVRLLNERKFTGEFIFKIHSLLKSALKKAKLWKWIADNPIDDIKPPKRFKRAKDTLTPAELTGFFAHCSNDGVRTMWTFFVLTGARPQEVLAARWRDIDFDKGTFSVEQVLVQQKRVKKFDQPKTATSKRIIPLAASLLQLLKKHKIEQNTARLKTGELWTDNDLIFCTRYGKPLRLSNLGEKVKKIKTAAGITKNITPHGFRHSFATLSRQAGEDLKVISEYLGHSSIKITADVYSHVDLTEKRQMSEAMSELILKTK